ncbi:hypothetical protein T492DRAFT_944669 [Pavlovales sp. CCMP2436]|nr:hypothetical protein T492DRAFT_944669 [Pavlovales sp. CCMP2436]
MAQSVALGRRGLPVYLYVPNLIGYVRVALNFVALHYALSDFRACLGCYALSALLDALDGYAARALDQSSTFGGVLDMVTDRTATASLCVVLAHLYPRYLPHFCALIMLDIFSHWAHVYASALNMASTHKSSTNWIVRLYYHKPILFSVCAGNELFYMFIYLHAFAPGPVLGTLAVPLILPHGAEIRVAQLAILLCAPVFVFKQLTNVIQMFIAFDVLITHDQRARKER